MSGEREASRMPSVAPSEAPLSAERSSHPEVNGGSSPAPSTRSARDAPLHPASEPPAAERFAEGGSVGEWQSRAEWLDAEAKAASDPATRARLWLAASEVRAMLGERREARRLALQAQARGVPFATRQARALCTTAADASQVLKGLREEAAQETRLEARLHAHHVAAVLARLWLRDTALSESQLEAAAQLDADDPLTTLERLLSSLARDTKAPELSVPDAAHLEPLPHVARELSTLRGGYAPDLKPRDGLASRLSAAQHALARGHRREAAAYLAPLESIPALKSSIHWLTTLLGSAQAAPDSALHEYRRLARENQGRAARRALAARALAARDGAALREALELSKHEAHGAPQDAALSSAPRSDAGEPAFSEAEKAALGALLPELWETGQAPEAVLSAAPAPLLRALERATSSAPANPSDASRAEADYVLGRRAALIARFTELEWDEPPGDGRTLCDLLRLERAREGQDLEQLARALPLLLSGSAAPGEAHYLLGVTFERRGELDRAREHYRAALVSPLARAAATRALTDGRLGAATGAASAAAFRSLSAHAGDAQRRALLLTEALLRSSPEAAEYDAVAEEATRADASLPFAPRLGELAARARGDRTRTARWLQRQAELAADGDELALCGMREASFLAASGELASARLSAIAASRPSDFALRLLLEQLTTAGARERALLREAMLETASPRAKERWRMEAVELHREAGDVAAAVAVARELQSPVGALWVETLREHPAAAALLVERWTALAQSSGDAELASDLYRRASELDASTGNLDRAADWHRARLALDARCTDALRALEVYAMARGREAELQRHAAALASVLPTPDAIGEAFLGGRLAIDAGALEEAQRLAELVTRSDAAEPWALRLRAAFARKSGDHRSSIELCRALRLQAREPLDRVTLTLRIAEALCRMGDPAAAKAELAEAARLAPLDLVVLALRAEVLALNGDHAEAAEAFEALASECHTAEKRADARYRAALSWLDSVGDRPRGVLALQAAAQSDPTHPGVAERLKQLLQHQDALIEARAFSAAPPASGSMDRERREAVVARARALSRAGTQPAAIQLLSETSAQYPDDAELLHALAELLLSAQRHKDAEQVWTRALAVVREGRARLEALFGLCGLYERELADPAKACRVYEDILELDPDDSTVRRRLVRSLTVRGELQPALAHQRELVERARGDEERRQYLLELVEFLERDPDGLEEARELLERAHRTWPDNPQILKAEVDHYRRVGDASTARLILERAAQRARDAVASGRFEPLVFRTLEVASRLGGDPEAARLARDTLAVLRGQPLGLTGAGLAVAQPTFDDLLAPAPLDAAFRRLMSVAGAALERAHELDPTMLGAQPLPDEDAAPVQTVAAAFGVSGARVLVAQELGCECMCVHADPMYVIFGRALLDHDDPRVRDFLLLRALKLAQVNACALSRMSGADAKAAVAGLFACFDTVWKPSDEEAERIAQARNRIRPHLTASLDPELAAAAADLARSLLPRAAELPDAFSAWAARAALLGVGDLGVALDGVWSAAQRGAPRPADMDARVRWLATEPRARDLVWFGISDAYIEARRRAGLSSASR